MKAVLTVENQTTFQQIELKGAWKYHTHRNSLTPQQLERLPLNPAGQVELSEAKLEQILGGGGGSGSASGIMKKPG